MVILSKLLLCFLIFSTTVSEEVGSVLMANLPQNNTLEQIELRFPANTRLKQNRVLNGIPIPWTEAPFSAALLLVHQGNIVGYCSASIVHKSLGLLFTSAHCFDIPATNYFVLVGTNDVVQWLIAGQPPGPVLYSLGAVVRHHHYLQGKKEQFIFRKVFQEFGLQDVLTPDVPLGDIAVIQTTAQINSPASASTLLLSGLYPATDEVVDVYGYGQDMELVLQRSANMRALQLVAGSNRLVWIHDPRLIGDQTESVGVGDSGGSMVYKSALLAVNQLILTLPGNPHPFASAGCSIPHYGHWVNCLLGASDTVAPDLLVPNDIQIYTKNPMGEVIEFGVEALDVCDPAPSVLCVPASGSTFPLGTTTVNCQATDGSNNKRNRSFKVIVMEAPMECTSRWECTPVSNSYSFVDCVNGQCTCLPTFEGHGSQTSKCRCREQYSVHFASGIPYCLAPGQCLGGSSGNYMCQSVTADYNYVRCTNVEGNTVGQCACVDTFDGAAKLDDKCRCDGSILWSQGIPTCVH